MEICFFWFFFVLFFPEWVLTVRCHGHFMLKMGIWGSIRSLGMVDIKSQICLMVSFNISYLYFLSFHKLDAFLFNVRAKGNSYIYAVCNHVLNYTLKKYSLPVVKKKIVLTFFQKLFRRVNCNFPSEVIDCLEHVWNWYVRHPREGFLSPYITCCTTSGNVLPDGHISCREI